MHAEALLDIPGDGADKLLVRVDGESGGLKTLLGDVFCHDLDNGVEVLADLVEGPNHRSPYIA